MAKGDIIGEELPTTEADVSYAEEALVGVYQASAG